MFFKANTGLSIETTDSSVEVRDSHDPYYGATFRDEKSLNEFIEKLKEARSVFINIKQQSR